MRYLIRIIVVDGIPCIVLEDEDEWEKARRKHKLAELHKPNFTDIMNEKSRKYYNQIKDDLKKKFGEK